MHQNTLAIAKNLISKASVTPNDAGCQHYIGQFLQDLNFTVKHLAFADVNNLFATIGPNKRPDICFVGHTDVVPSGDPSLWKYPPFDAVEQDGFLYGRGTQDMKGAIAAWLSALTVFIQFNPNFTIGILLTSDEEGAAEFGIRKMAPYLNENGMLPKFCIIGEPSSETTTGDMIKIGRRGSLSAELLIHGQQGHIAYPDKAQNPIHFAVWALNDLLKHNWDQQNSAGQFPATSLQISDIDSGLGVGNMIPNQLKCQFNIRFAPTHNDQFLIQSVEKILNSHQLDYQINWKTHGTPYITESESFIHCIQNSIQDVTGKTATRSTSGGTSDGRFLAPLGAQVIELGLPNDRIHQIDERVRIKDLNTLTEIYLQCLRAFGDTNLS